ncbi:TonB-dependent receptor domain-containing protein [Nitritalea halalkaliphila]|uniref:TonB-dependent receptor domain-containing protein n=1 Tax=Nitritalea halalkaliphila TaxID=590849 RepID=UPI000303308C|nr:TonB-dependent receptor [Nitritalea halalkaliphila]
MDTYTVNARFYRHFGRGVQQIFGFQWQRMENRQRGFEFLLPNFNSEQGGLFFFHEQTAREGFTWNAGLRLDFGTHDIQEHLQPIFRRQQPTGEFDQRNPDIERFMGNLSGGTGLSWLIHPDHLLKVNLGSAFRMPTAIELATNGVHHGNFRHEIGNPDLRPERSYQVDLSYAWQRKSFYLALTPFWSFYEGFIYLAPTGRFSNLPASGMMWEYRQHDAVFMGTELKAEWKLHRRWTLSSAFEYVYNYNLDTGLPLPLTPPLSVLNGLRYEAKTGSGTVRQWGGFIEHRISAAQNRVDRNELRTDGFMLLEAGFHLNLRLFNQPLQVQASGQNLLDTFYFNHLSRYRLLNLPEQGRNFILTLKVPIGEKNEKN